MTKLIKKLSEPKYILVLASLYTLLITFALLTPVSTLPKPTIFLGDKFVHSLIHFGLAFLWMVYYYRSQKGLNFLKMAIVIFLLCLSYGIIIEIFQEVLTTTRRADVYDVLANTFGSFVGIFVFLRVKHVFKI